MTDVNAVCQACQVKSSPHWRKFEKTKKKFLCNKCGVKATRRGLVYFAKICDEKWSVGQMVDQARRVWRQVDVKETQKFIALHSLETQETMIKALNTVVLLKLKKNNKLNAEMAIKLKRGVGVFTL